MRLCGRKYWGRSPVTKPNNSALGALSEELLHRLVDTSSFPYLLRTILLLYCLLFFFTEGDDSPSGCLWLLVSQSSSFYRVCICVYKMSGGLNVFLLAHSFYIFCGISSAGECLFVFIFFCWYIAFTENRQCSAISYCTGSLCDPDLSNQLPGKPSIT